MRRSASAAVFAAAAAAFVSPARARGPSTCALNSSAACPLPTWPPAYELARSSIVYQPWCTDNGDPYLCTGLFNASAWWAYPENRDKGSVREAHWGLISLDDSTSTLVWQQPGDVLSAHAQRVMVENCNFVKSNGWADRCFVYDNNVNALGWYETHREKMLDNSSWSFFNIMNNNDPSYGLANLTGLPYQESGGVVPCWSLPPQSPDPTLQWCWPLQALRLPCFARGDCNTTAGGGGFGFYWNYSVEGVSDWRIADNLAFVLSGGDGVDGLFTDEMEMFPGDHGDVVLKTLGTTQADAEAQQDAGNLMHQRLIETLAANGKWQWQAFQSGNTVGGNTNNNTGNTGGFAFDAAFCTQWMAQRCNTDWVNQRAIAVQFDKFNVNVSVASFLIVRPAYAWLGYGAGEFNWPPTWNDAFLWDVGLPVGECAQTAPGVFEREWTFGTATMDCNSYTATVPCNPADKTCGEPPRPPVPPFVPANFSASHNCTGCGGAGGVQLGDSLVNLSFEECLAYCEANALCKYVNWLEPPGDGLCALYSVCGVQCLPSQCWGWWTTYEFYDRAPAVWNTTACDSLPEKPSQL